MLKTKIVDAMGGRSAAVCQVLRELEDSSIRVEKHGKEHRVYPLDAVA